VGAQQGRQEPGQHCQDRAVGPVWPGPGDLTAQDRDFMSEHQDLGVLRRLAAAQQEQPAEDPEHDQIQKAKRHKPPSCPNIASWPNRRSQPLCRVLKRYRVSRDDEIGRDALGVLGAAFEAVLAFGLLDLEPKDIEPSARKLLLAPDEIDQLLGEREDARRRGDFAVADEIRDMLERLGIEVRDTPEGAVLIAIRPSRKHRPPTSDSAAPPGLDRRASHEDQIVNLGLMATDFPQYRLSFDRPE
jgi:hypothetical protein